MTRIRRRLQQHDDFIFLLGVFVAFRAFSLLFFSPADRIQYFSDFGIYLVLARWSDFELYPYLDFWSEYPPLFPWLTILLYRLVRTIPIWGHIYYDLWFHVALAAILLAADTLILVLVYRLARHLHPPARAFRASLAYAFMFMPAFAMMAWFDALPTALLLAALWFAVRRRWLATGLVAGLGAMVKLFPAVVVVAAARMVWERRERRSLALLVSGAMVVPLALLLPLFAISPEFTTASLTSPLLRSSWETIGALLEGYFGVGALQGNRFLAAEAALPSHPVSLPWPLLTGATVGLVVLSLTRRLRSEPATLVALSGLLLHLLLLGSKGWSPQYLVWLLPFMAILMPPWRAFTYAIALTALNFLEAPVHLFMLGSEVPWLLSYTVVGRTLVLGVLAVEYAGLAFNWDTVHQRLRLAPHALAAALALVFMALIPSLGRTYFERQLEESPYSQELRVLQASVLPGEVLLIVDEETYGRMLPFAARLIPTSPVGWPQEAAGFDAYIERKLREADGIWLCGEDENLSSLLGDRFQEVSRFRVNACSFGHWVRRPADYVMLETPLRVGDVGFLLGYRWDMTSEGARLRLLWEVAERAELDYSVFVHVLDANGALLDQADSSPCQGACPTSRWTRGELIEDVHPTPEALERAATVAVGLYRWDTLERLPARQNGELLPDDRLLLPPPAQAMAPW